MTDFCKYSFHEVKIIAITGPTATGKTGLAVKLARELDGEIISVDSRQVYRHLDIGSGKDLSEYGEIKAHLLDIADPVDEEYNLHMFCRDAFAAIADIAGRGKLPILCGGSALYMAAILENYRLPGAERDHSAARGKRDLTAANSFVPDLKLDILTLGVLYPRQEVRERIQIRLDDRLAHGMVEEVRTLLEMGVTPEKMEYFGLEYREITRYIQGKCDFDAMRKTLLDRIRQFAKRQDIFFRKMEREGVEIHWIERGDPAQALKLAKLFLAGKQLPEISFRLSEHRNPPSR